METTEHFTGSLVLAILNSCTAEVTLHEASSDYFVHCGIHLRFFHVLTQIDGPFIFTFEAKI